MCFCLHAQFIGTIGPIHAKNKRCSNLRLGVQKTAMGEAKVILVSKDDVKNRLIFTGSTAAAPFLAKLAHVGWSDAALCSWCS